MAEVTNATRHPLPYGFFSRRHYNVYLLIMILTVALDTFLSILLYRKGSLHHILLFVIFQIVLISTVSVIAYLVQNPMIGILKRFYTTCNFTKFNRSVSTILKYRLHPETIKFVILLWVKYMYLYDASEAEFIFNQMLPPKGMFNQYLYRYNLVQHYVHIEDYHEASDLIRKEFEKSKKVNLDYVKSQKDLEMFDRRYMIKNFVYEIPKTNKIYLLSVRNNYIKMCQNVIDGELREAKLIAKYLEDHAGDLGEVIYAATQILKKRVLVSKESMLDHTDNGVVKEKSDIDLNQLLSEIEQETAQAKQEEEIKESAKNMPKSIEEAIILEQYKNPELNNEDQ